MFADERRGESMSEQAERLGSLSRAMNPTIFMQVGACRAAGEVERQIRCRAGYGADDRNLTVSGWTYSWGLGFFCNAFERFRESPTVPRGRGGRSARRFAHACHACDTSANTPRSESRDLASSERASSTVCVP